VVLTDSHGISRAPCYLGYSPGRAQHYGYGAHTLSGRPFKTVHLCLHLTSLVRQNQNGKSHNPAHATPAGYHTWKRFSLIRVRSPLLTESLLFSLPAGTEMFHFPAFPPRTLCVQMRVTQSPCSVVRGFPIRTSWDQRSVINSPRLIADSYVLLRLLMPRHPPCALKNLTTQDQKLTRENHDHKGQVHS
jgi:hypothetical protein